MGHHIDDQGRFQSDKFPNLPPDYVAVKISQKTAGIISRLAFLYEKEDPEFADDLEHAA